MVGEVGTLSLPKKTLTCRWLFSLSERHMFATACHDRLFPPCLLEFLDNPQPLLERSLYWSISGTFCWSAQDAQVPGVSGYFELHEAMLPAPGKGSFGLPHVMCPSALLRLLLSSLLLRAALGGCSGMDITLQLRVWLHCRNFWCCCLIGWHFKSFG